MTEQTPETFDVDAYIAEATSPETTVAVYTRGHLYGDIVELQNKIEIERAAAREDDEALDGGVVAELEDQYEKVLLAFTDSKLTLRLRALTSKREAEIREKYKDEGTQVLAYRLIHDSLVSPVIPEYGKWERFLEVIGKGQADKVAREFNQVQNGVMKVSPDFLQRRSSRSDSRE